ncbi:DMT family transporter [Nostoc sp. CENA67]|uniref:DMT family transporter n=1 Tax=Amazonocrinis nigriterrae CENA67 TaxID=2794033 RepID=A0A8J7HZ80_9NOST|nr:DMT family transporter [Amazonocrinis nigriterrae]MBH8566360.1 DMT family transporter [Amazonocrinis nigriterrae CENA67]
MTFITETHKHTLGLVLIVVTALILGTIPAAIKEAIASLSPATQFAIRFTIAAIILTPFLRNLNVKLVRDGAMLGVLLFGVFATATIGLETISANQASFIFGLNMVFVTLFELLFRKRISMRALLAVILAFTGIGVMSWKSGESAIGNLWLLSSALSDAAYIIVLEVFSPNHSPIPLVTIQLWVVAVLGLLWAAPELTQHIETIQASLGVLIYLSVVATVLVLLFQTLAQQWISAHEVALFLALEPVFGAIFAFLLLGETFSVRSFIGAVIVLVGISLILIPAKIDESDSQPPQLQESTVRDGTPLKGEVLLGVLNNEREIEELF